MKVFLFLIVSTYAHQQYSQPCPKSFSVKISEEAVNDGDIIFKDGVTYNKSNYFHENGITYGCICNLKSCIRKCCAASQIMKNKTCVAHLEKVNIRIHKQDKFLYSLNPMDRLQNFHFIRYKCHALARLNPVKFPDTDAIYMQEDGQLYLPNAGLHTNYLDHRRYCVEMFDDKMMKMKYSAILCQYEDNLETDNAMKKMLSFGMMISMPFLLATFLVYAILPDHNIHKKALMYYVMSLFMAYVFLVCIQLPTTEYSEASCTSLGVFCIFFFLLSFFWMNVICVDMFLGFRGFRGFSGNKSSEKKRFIWYNVYAWGMSLTITIVIIIINQAGNPDKWFHPNLGIGQCYIRDGLPLLIYFYMPMGLLITVNLALFIFTALKIRQVKKETKVLRKGDSKRHSDDNDKQKFNLYLKLLFAMGVNWSMEIVSWAVSYKYQQSIPSYVWYLTDFCNASYGVFIFFIFVFKKSVWKQLQRRYYAFRGKQHLAHSMTTTNQTASSAVDTNRNSDDQEMALSSTR